MLPFTRAPFWVPILEPQPNVPQTEDAKYIIEAAPLSTLGALKPRHFVADMRVSKWPNDPLDLSLGFSKDGAVPEAPMQRFESPNKPRP